MRISNVKTEKRFFGGGLKRIFERAVAFVISGALMITPQLQFCQVFAKNDTAEVIYVSCDGQPGNDGLSPENALDFYGCFSDEGVLKSGFSGKTLVFCGDFTNLDEESIFIDEEIELIGDGAKFKNVTFTIVSDNVTLKDFEITQENGEYTINVDDCKNVTIEGNTINTTALSGYDCYAVYSRDCDNLIMRDNIITYVGNTDGTVFNNAVRVEAMKRDGITTVENNVFDITLPSVDISYDPETWESMILNHGIIFEGCAELTISGNDIKVKSNGTKVTAYGYDSLYGVGMLNRDRNEKQSREMDVKMERNNIEVSGEAYTYGVYADAYTYGQDSVMIHLNMVENTVKVSGEKYAYDLCFENCVKVNAENNELYADAKEVNCGIYVYPYMGANDELTFVDNAITGKGRYSIGMDIYTVEDIEITGNTIYSLGSNALDESGRVVPTGSYSHPARTSPAITLRVGGSADSALVSGNEIMSGGAGLILQNGKIKYNIVDNDILVNDAKYGLKLTSNEAGAVIENNTIKVITLEDDEGYGIYSYDSDSVSILNNFIEYTGKSDGKMGHFNNAVYVSGEKGVSGIEIEDNTLDINLTSQTFVVPDEGERPLLGGLVFDGCDNLSLLNNIVSMDVAEGNVPIDNLYAVDMMVLKARPENAIGKAVVNGNGIVTMAGGIHSLVPSEMTENLVISGCTYTVDVFVEDKAAGNASIITGNKLWSGELQGDESVHATNVDTVQNNMGRGHGHEFTYVADGATITATCVSTNGDCLLDDGTDEHKHTATLTIGAPLHTVADDGKDAGAVITDENGIQGEAKVKYQTRNGNTYGEETETAPTVAGDYKASITLGEGQNGATAYVEYTIAQAAVDIVTAAINSLPAATNVTKDDRETIEAARAAYNALDNTQKALVDDATLQKLTDAEDQLVIIQVMSEVSAKSDSGIFYTGNPIQLINAPTTALPEGYAMKYVVTTENTAPTDDNLYTTSIPTATDVGTYYVWYKVTGDANHQDVAPQKLTVVIEREIAKVKMYRLYNPNSGEHFYTASTQERDDLTALGWNCEGIAWNAPETSSIPVYRLYNPNAGDHHYTPSEDERDMLVNAGWNYEGIGWYSDENMGVPVHRLYNPNATGAGAHHYTTSDEECQNLIDVGWNYEGIGWHGAK